MAVSSTVLLLTGALVAATTGAVAFFVAPGDQCAVSDLEPEPSGSDQASTNKECKRLPSTCQTDPDASDSPRPSEETGLLRFEFDITKRGGQARICIQDETGEQVIDRTVDLPSRTFTPVEVRLPPGPLQLGYVIDGRIVSTHKDLDLTDCPQQAFLIQHQAGLGWFGSSVKSSSTSDCFDPDEVDREDATYTISSQDIGPPSATLPPAAVMRTTIMVAAFAGTVGLAGAAALRMDRFQWVLAGLFTRIRPRQALSHGVRARIEQTVRADPGIRQDELRTLLNLGHGQAAHHLQILVRHGVLEPLHLSGARHFFPGGAHGEEEKKQLALLHHRAARTLYETLRTHGDTDITTLAAKCGYSVPYTSRVSARLASAGLAKRERQGKRVILGLP